MNHSAEDPYRTYREHHVSGLTPGRLVLLALDTAIRAGRKGERGRLIKVVEELMAGLDLDRGEIAAGLLRLYEYILHDVREGRIAESCELLQELRTTWEIAVRQEEERSLAATIAAAR